MNLAGHSSQQGGQVARVLPKVGSGGTIFSGPISAFSAASVSTEVARLSPSSSIEWENPSPVAIRKNTPNRRESFRFWSPEGMRQPACASLSTRRRSVRRPRPEFLGVAYGPDVLDPGACDLEGEHRHGDAVLLSDQAGLAVDGPFEERSVAGCPAGDFDPGARDLLAAFDGAQECSGEAAAVGWGDGGAGRAAGHPFRVFGQRLGDPFADVGLSPGPGRAEQVEADAAGDRGKPGAGGCDGVLLLRGHGVPAGVGLLDSVLSFGQGAQQPVGEANQVTPLAHERVQARTGSAPA